MILNWPSCNVFKWRVVKFICWEAPAWFLFKGEADNTAADPSAESAAPAKPPDSVEVEPKGDVIEPTPPASVELSMEEMTDEGVDSNKTSVESLREANENNSNNAGPRQQRGRCWGLSRVTVQDTRGWAWLSFRRTCSHDVSSPTAAV